MAALSVVRVRARAANEDLLRRFEDKYFVATEYRAELLELLGTHLAPSYLTQDTRYNLIESLYFDADCFTLFQLHFQSPAERFKLRIRRYAPNGDWERSNALVELKVKEGRVSDKTRFGLSDADARELLEGRPVVFSGELRSQNPTLKKSVLRERLALLNSVMASYELKPKCRVLYQRQSFEKDGIRVTLDEGLRSEMVAVIPGEIADGLRGLPCYPAALAMRSRFQRAPFLVCEVKHGREVPSWLGRYVLARAGLNTRFSKYCYAIAGALDDRMA
ncbi:MAG: VTC domain-containing protein [Oligoflexia bacterium]|nr:VTC domain-containing protein [Oligoflexia bacterium]